MSIIPQFKKSTLVDVESHRNSTEESCSCHFYFTSWNKLSISKKWSTDPGWEKKDCKLIKFYLMVKKGKKKNKPTESKN